MQITDMSHTEIKELLEATRERVQARLSGGYLCCAMVRVLFNCMNGEYTWPQCDNMVRNFLHPLLREAGYETNGAWRYTPDDWAGYAWARTNVPDAVARVERLDFLAALIARYSK